MNIDQLKKSKYRGVPGVLKIDSGKPGPVLGITVCTHGNELCGPKAVLKVYKKLLKPETLKRGAVIFVINNLKAMELALATENKEDRLKARYIDVNMNRLPKNLSSLENDERYEIKRAQELLPVWKEFDYSLDIHSMAQTSPAMIIMKKNLGSRIIENFPIKLIIKNIQSKQIGKSASSFYGKEGVIKAIAIEAGQHEEAKSVSVSEVSILALLKNLEMISCELKLKNIKKEEFVITESVLAEKDMVMSRIYKNFEKISKNEVLARVRDKEVKSPFDGYILMVPGKRKIIKTNEEAFFLAQKIN